MVWPLDLVGASSSCPWLLYFQGFDNLKAQAVAPPQWTMRNLDDRLVPIGKRNLQLVPAVTWREVLDPVISCLVADMIT